MGGVRRGIKQSHYDVMVIGSGGGAKVASPSHQLGFTVAVAEHGFDAFGTHKHGLGGTCLNRGCIPSKMLIHAADVATSVRDAHRFGVHAAITDVSWSQLVTRVEHEIDGDSTSIERMYSKSDPAKRRWVRGTTRFVAPRTLRVRDRDATTGAVAAEEEEITADYVVVAGGCVPMIPPIPGLANTPYLTSTEALRLKEQPKRLAVLGGGYIACELAHFYGGLGTTVHMFARSELLSAMKDNQTRRQFQTEFTAQYPHVYTSSTVDRVDYDATRRVFTLTYRTAASRNDTRVVEVDQLLVATGVRPMTKELNAAAGGLQLDKHGYIKVNDKLQTHATNTWAFGDIISGGAQFRHIANYQGEYLMETLFHPLRDIINKSTANTTARVTQTWAPSGEQLRAPVSLPVQPPIEYGHIPWAVFSSPQVAGVGASEDELIKAGIPYVVGVNPYKNSAMGMALRSTGGFVKLLVSRDDTRRILGCYIIGEQASVLIHQVMTIMRYNGTLDDILYMIHIHPALSELIRNAARRAKQSLIDAGLQLPLKLMGK